jgi:hypothetical protein
LTAKFISRHSNQEKAMSEIYVVWAKDAHKAQARLEQIANGEQYRVLRRGDFALIQVEDLDNQKSLDSGSARYSIVFELPA